MKKVELVVEEKLTYRRNIEVEVPDSMDESSIEAAVSKAEKEEFLDDFISVLAERGIVLTKPIDSDLSSPDRSEIECEEFDFVE